MNKKLLLVAGVLSVVSGNVMAERNLSNPVNIVRAHDNINVAHSYEKLSVWDTRTGKLVETNIEDKVVTIGLNDNLQDIREVNFKKESNGFDGYYYNKIDAKGIDLVVRSDQPNSEVKTYVGPGQVSISSSGKYGGNSYLGTGTLGVFNNLGDSMSFGNDGLFVYNDKQGYQGGTSLKSTGLDNGGFKIINVAKGVADTDAVNVSQLKKVENKISNIHQNVLNQANHYTDTQVNKGVAKASALAGFKFLDYNPKDKWSFAASVGHYRNANAVAVGAAYQPNENTMIHGGITVDGKVAYNLGLSFKVGGQKYINKYELAEQVKQLQSDNALLREELAELRSMIEKK